MTPSSGISLERSRTQAKELHKKAMAADPEALQRIRQRHPEGDAPSISGRLQLSDCQLVIAREFGYESWPRLKQDLLFRNAVAALDTGDRVKLGGLLDDEPSLIEYHCRIGEWYEEGYFKGAALLHHIAGNPIRCPIAANILDVARLLLSRNADPNAATDAGVTTIGLLLSGSQASNAGVAVPLIELLRAAGARDDLSGPWVLDDPLLNGAPETAAELIRLGHPMQLRHAAGLGRIDRLESLLAGENDPTALEEALLFASIRGQEEAARALVRHGAKGDRLLAPRGMPRTALHEAANRGHLGIVRLLLDHGADPTVVEPRWGGTPAGWAKEGHHPDIVALLKSRTPE